MRIKRRNRERHNLDRRLGSTGATLAMLFVLLAGFGLPVGFTSTATAATTASLRESNPQTTGPRFRPAAVPVSPNQGLLVIVPLTVPPTERGLVTAEELATYTSINPTGPLAQKLEAVSSAIAAPGGRGQIALAVDPMIVASIRVLGDGAPASATAWLNRLEALPVERFELAYADADPTLFTQSSLASAPATRGLQAIADASKPTGQTKPESVSTPGTSATATQHNDNSPSGGIAAVLQAIGPIYWPRPGTVAARDLATLDADGDSLLLLHEADVARDAAALASGSVLVDGHRAIVQSAGAGAAVATAIAAQSDAQWTSAIGIARNIIESEMALGPVIVALDRSAATPSDRLTATLTALKGIDASGHLTLRSLLDRKEGIPAAQLKPSRQDPVRLSQFELRVTAEQELNSFAAALVEPNLLIERARLETLAIASISWADETTWAATVADSVKRATETTQSVRVVPSSSLFLADRSQLPVAIQNDSAYEVTVLVNAHARTGRLDVEDSSVSVQIPAASQTTVEFEARAVSNGTAHVAVWMTTQAGAPLGVASDVVVNVQAGWEGLFTAGFITTVLVLLALGIVRTVLRHRRTSRGRERHQVPFDAKEPAATNVQKPRTRPETDRFLNG